MPELPEVETIRRQLEKEIVGCTIADVWYDRPKMLRPSPEEFVKGVAGKTIAGVGRRAKLLIFDLGGSFFVCHLRLSGRLLVRQKNDESDDYVHVVLKLKAQKGAEDYDLELRFAEARLFGYMRYLPDEASLGNILEKCGPEPLDDLDGESFYSILQKTSRPIKLVLLDQELVSGIGNIYASEALWLSKIYPQRAAKSLSKGQSDSLLKSIEDVFKEGLKYGGASDQWYRQTHGEKGSYQEHFKVYSRNGQPCLRGDGGIVKRVALGGRGTFFCPECQR